MNRNIGEEFYYKGSFYIVVEDKEDCSNCAFLLHCPIFDRSETGQCTKQFREDNVSVKFVTIKVNIFKAIYLIYKYYWKQLLIIMRKY